MCRYPSGKGTVRAHRGSDLRRFDSCPDTPSLRDKMFEIHLKNKEDVEDLMDHAREKCRIWRREIQFCGKDWWAGSEEVRLRSLEHCKDKLKRWVYIKGRCKIALSS